MLLTTRTVEKPWGKDTLPAPFETPAGERIGEIWFEPPPELPELLVKYIFTSEKLSVQVHPSDSQTEETGLGKQGKEECWLVIDAEPGATLGVGFANAIGSDTLRAAARDGSIERMMEWYPVKAGDFFYIPANTVHAIGGGCSIIEIQQNSDITYRLYDYGRPRELHLDEAVAVAQAVPHDPVFRSHVPEEGNVELVNGPYFRLDRIAGAPDRGTVKRYADGPLLVVPRVGAMIVAGDAIAPGQCALANSIEDVQFDPNGTCLVTQPCPDARS